MDPLTTTARLDIYEGSFRKNCSLLFKDFIPNLQLEGGILFVLRMELIARRKRKKEKKKKIPGIYMAVFQQHR